MKIKTRFSESLKIDFPLIMAPMFLVSNEAMLKSAMRMGIMGVAPSLNFRKEGEFEQLLQNLTAFYRSGENKGGSFGINLIVQKSNPLVSKHLDLSIKYKVPFFITSLGNPKEVIEKAHAYGAKVFCDVTNTEHARKAYVSGCDGFIAVGQGAGGHAGPYPLQVLIPSLVKKFPDMPVIAAGGIASGNGILSSLALGAAGVSIGTRFIASHECPVNDEYKKAVVDSGMENIVLTTKISGTPCTIIDTPYAKKIGYTQNFAERFLSRNPKTKKWFKLLVQLQGMKRLRQSVKPAGYKTLWCAGQSVEMVGDILPCEDIIERLKQETEAAMRELKGMVNGM